MEIKRTLAQLSHIYTLINFWLGRLIEAELPPCVFVRYAILFYMINRTQLKHFRSLLLLNFCENGQNYKTVNVGLL